MHPAVRSLPFMKHLTRTLILPLLFALPCAPALAGRPLSTDDATTSDGGCQLEAWVDRLQGQAAAVLAPACALAPGLELDADLTHFSPGSHTAGDPRTQASLALKWAPQAAVWPTPWGPVNLGAKLGLSGASTVGTGWRRSGYGALALATLTVSPQWSLHLNLGPERSLSAHRTSTLLNLAASWTPVDSTLLFVEVLANDRPALNGSSVRSAGARRWLGPQLGLDLTASRTAGATATTWGLGLGWYGL
jgi:hypothetical protein